MIIIIITLTDKQTERLIIIARLTEVGATAAARDMVNMQLRIYISYIYTRFRRTHNATNTGRRMAVDPGPAIFVDVNTATVAAAVPRAIRRG